MHCFLYHFHIISCYDSGNTRPELTAEMLRKLSQQFTSESDVMKLGISGFRMEDFKVKDCMDRNNSCTDAAQKLLMEWRKGYLDDQEAY